jgi:transketolase
MFAAGRAFEIIRNSIGYTRANVKICATHAGITVGEDGASHQTFEDIALMRTIPGMTIINPCDGVSAKLLLEKVVAFDGPAYVRLGRAAVPVFYEENADIQIGKGNCLKDGNDVTIIATGIMVSKALSAAETLGEKGVDVRVVDMHTIKPIDKDIIIKAAKETKGIVVAEEHSVIGGLGSAVAEVITQNYPAKLAFVGQKDTFGESGKPDELLVKYGMSEGDIIEGVLSLV